MRSIAVGRAVAQLGLEVTMAQSTDAARPTAARADLHVHSKYSDRPSEWFLRRIGAPECFVEPLEIYQRARQRGFDFVTISDHNRIEGALEIAHLPHVFISAEVTTYFPEDGAKIHLLVLGITESQFAMIQELRPNIYELREYCVAEDIVTSVAHPLFRVNDRLTVDHVEKLLVLFNRFEGVNGTRDRRACDVANAILRDLTPAQLGQLAEKHGIAPSGATPWLKTLTGGSDDHSGLYIGSAHTVTPRASTVDEFLAHLRRGRHEMAGSHGTSSRLAHSFYQIACSYYDHLLRPHATRSSHPLLGQLLSSMLEERKPVPAFGSVLGARVRSLAGRFERARRMRRLSETERLIVADLREIFASEAAVSATTPEQDRVVFERACRLSQTLACAFLRRFEEHVRDGRLLESLQSLASVAPVAVAIAPYLTAYRTQHKDEQFLRQVARRFPGASEHVYRSDRRAWITDTLSDVNGVAVTVRRLGAEARRMGLPLTIVTCEEEPARLDADLANFRPVGTFGLPEYPGQRLSFPPFLEVLDHLERNAYRELIISTPGPMGLVGVLAARLLGLRTIGIYHTDFPAYARTYTQDSSLEEAAWRFMQAFYGTMDAIVAPSDSCRRQLIRRGFEETKIEVMERGVDLEQFGPDRRVDGFYQQWGLKPGFTYLYVGRVSREKNLDILMDAFSRMIGRGRQANLALVGDGPERAQLQQRFGSDRIAFLGYLHGDVLASAYASADAFVFPSTTDTFGNVVLEAQASGLPCIVSDLGGPQEIVGRHDSGVITNMTDPAGLAAVMEQLMDDPQLRRTLRGRALASAGECNWTTVLQRLWGLGDRLVEEVPERVPARPPVLTPEILQFS